MLKRFIKSTEILPLNKDEDVTLPLFQTTRELKVEQSTSTRTSSPSIYIPMEEILLHSNDNVPQPQEQTVPKTNVTHSEEDQNANNDNTIAVKRYNPNHRNRLKSFNGLPRQNRLGTKGSLVRRHRRASLPSKFDDFFIMTLKRRLNTQLLKALRGSNDKEVKRLLIIGTSPNATNDRLTSACHIAALKNNGKALKRLLKRNADKNKRDDSGFTPLHYAAWKGSNWAVAVLLGIPKDLQKACKKFPPDIEEKVKELRPQIDIDTIEVRNDPNDVLHNVPESWLSNKDSQDSYSNILTDCYIPEISNRENWTPLHVASYRVQYKTVRLLLAAGADPNSQDKEDYTPLDVAGGHHLQQPNKYICLDDYEKTVTALIEYGGKPKAKKLFLDETVLHTAVEIGSVNAVRELLAVGVPIDTHNAEGDTPLHKCVSKHYEEPLKILAQHTIPGSEYKPINLTDCYKNTVLHAAILASWLPGVRIALDAGADLIHQNEDGYTAIDLAAREENVDILKTVLDSAKLSAIFETAINVTNGLVESPLLCAMRFGDVERVKMILKYGASLKVTYYIEPGNESNTHLYSLYNNYMSTLSTKEKDEFNMIVHAAAEIGNVDVLRYLLSVHQELNRLYFYRCRCLMNMTPLEFAAYHDRFDTFSYLLNGGFFLEGMESHFLEKSRLLDIITCLSRDDMYYKLMEMFPDSLSIAIRNGHRPLHNAIKYCSKNVILHMIDRGADLSQTDYFGNTAISLITEHIPKPTEFIEKIFTFYIGTNDISIQNRDCEITVDYRALMPPEDSDPQSNKGGIRILKALLEHDRKNQRKLLAHPLVESFIELQWQSLAIYFYIMMSFYISFVLFLSGYIVIVFYYKDDKERLPIPAIFNQYGWQFTMYFMLFVCFVLELIGFNQSLKSWTWKFSMEFVEFITKCTTYIFALITPWIVTMEPENTEPQRCFAIVTLVLGWLIIMILLSKSPMSGYYIQMFWDVSKKILKILFTFLFLILMFSFCFMIQFHSKVPFDGPISAIMKTFVMMTSEFEYENNFSDASKTNSANSTFTLIALRVIFIVFLIPCAIVLMNLMVGVAVDDVQRLVQEGNLRRLEQQVGFLNKLDASRRNKSFYHKFKLSRWTNYKEVPKIVKIKPVNDGNCCFSKRIKDLIITLAQDKLDKKEKKKEVFNQECKLGKIFEAITMLNQNMEKMELKLNKISETFTQREEIMKKEILEAIAIRERDVLKIESK